MRWLALIVLTIGCASSEPEFRQIAAKRVDVVVNGRLAVPPDLDYRWELVERPPGSTAQLENVTTPNPTFFSDQSGEYHLEVAVGAGVARARYRSFVVEVINIPPEAEADGFLARFVTARIPKQLDATRSRDEDGDALSFRWTLVSSPPDANVELDSLGASPYVTVDLPGAYEVRVDVSDGDDESSASIQFTALPYVLRLGESDVVDADYSKALDTLAVADEYGVIHLYDVAADETRTLTLGSVTAVDISTDGLTLAIAHGGQIGVYDLATLAEIRTVNPGVAPTVMALRDASRVHFMGPSTAPSPGDRLLHTLDVGTGQVTSVSVPANYSQIRIPPNQDALYVSSGLNISKYTTTPPLVRTSFDVSAFARGGDFWFSDTGDRIFAARKAVLNASPDPAVDYTEVGELMAASVDLIAVTESSEAGRVIAITRPAPEQLLVFDSPSLAPIGTARTPDVTRDGRQIAETDATHVFFTEDGGGYRLVLEGLMVFAGTLD